jgi:hypothetical protein
VYQLPQLLIWQGEFRRESREEVSIIGEVRALEHRLRFGWPGSYISHDIIVAGHVHSEQLSGLM